MSQGHSDVIHYTRPDGAAPTDDVELFIRQAKAAGTVRIIARAKRYTDAGGGLHWLEAKYYTMEANQHTGHGEGPKKPWFGPWPIDGLVNMTK